MGKSEKNRHSGVKMTLMKMLNKYIYIYFMHMLLYGIGSNKSCCEGDHAMNKCI